MSDPILTHLSVPCSVEVAVVEMLVVPVEDADDVCVDDAVVENERLAVEERVDVAVLVADEVAVVLMLVVAVELPVDEAEDVAVVVSEVVGEEMSHPLILPAANSASAEFRWPAEPAHALDDTRSSNSPEHSTAPSW